MSWMPCLVESGGGSEVPMVRLGHPLVDRYLEFVAARGRANTVLAAGYDLKVFFSIVGKDPVEVTTGDVLGFITAQRGDQRVIRIARWRVGHVAADDPASSVDAVGAVLVPGGSR